ncbi:hypothetical protein QTP70_009113 [Hemibagrus guttatus]|uniref:Ephrin RBD domain-containing protein n=1 Tax=Hemibagrus guttatus TaxID=175788 RepID=A0AAE0PYQ2_9TELE|nr:hypothetical protein QTP70_009113 [Hemibagrus guttatus]
MDLMWKTLLALFLIVCRLKLSVSTILESIYWNTSNTKFVPGKGITLYPQIGDKMDIVCPRLRPGQSASTHIEYFRVYLVTQEQLESCRVAKGNVALLNCDKPDQDVKFTFKFQEFSPNLWGLEFLKGKDYHVICFVQNFYALENRILVKGSEPIVVICIVLGELLIACLHIEMHDLETPAFLYSSTI